MSMSAKYREVSEVQKPVVRCGPSRTKQAFRDQCDINKILDTFGRTGMLEHISGRTPFYGDVSNIRSYSEALAIVDNAETLFNGMSSKVRERFRNDPALMIEFLSDSKNREEAIGLGMVKAPDAPAAPAVPAAGVTPPK